MLELDIFWVVSSSLWDVNNGPLPEPLVILQACIVTLWSGSGAPWVELQKKDSLARLLTVFITWAALRLFLGTSDPVLILQGRWEDSAGTFSFVGFWCLLHLSFCSWLLG